MLSYHELLEEAYADPCVSYALKDALRAADKRDSVDALYDAKTLVFVLQQRVNEGYKNQTLLRAR